MGSSTAFDEPIISITHGQVRGSRLQSVYDDVYFAFEGIPYARPPVGELRFKAPVDVEPWADILDCQRPAAKPVQYNRSEERVDGNEDCLYLNVYAKQLNSAKALPVMVYLHGGAFNSGDASRRSLPPDSFMLKDVVLITIGFRVGAFGFVGFRDPDVDLPGNAGIKDQVLALRWIRANVAQFNGDPKNITLFGHSSGSASAHCLMLSEQCRGLFHKGILMAGSAWPIATVPNMEYRMACAMGYDGPQNDRDIYKFLMEAPSESLAEFNFLTDEENRRGYIYPFGPRIEPYESEGAILTSNAMEEQRRAWSNNIPIMLGATSKEGLIQHQVHSQEKFYQLHRAHPEYILPVELSVGLPLEKQREIANELIKFHFGCKEFGEHNAAEMSELFSYAFVYHKMSRVLGSRLSHSMAPTYLYRFDFDSPTVHPQRVHQGSGPTHGDELAYLFHGSETSSFSRDSKEFKMIDRLMDMWTAFALRSDPNTQSTKPAVWKPVERFGPRKCFNISQEMTFIEWPESHKSIFWDEVYTKAGLQLS